LKAPRLIARSSVALVRWATLDRLARVVGEIDRDLATTPNPFVHPMGFLSLFTGQGAASRRRSNVDAIGRHGPGGRLAQLVRALP
jgi:hypothetical protein